MHTSEMHRIPQCVVTQHPEDCSPSKQLVHTPVAC